MLLKEKWIQQEALKKKKKTSKTKEREQIEEATIRIVEYPEPINEDPVKIETAEHINPLLAEFADSVSSDILKEAKRKNSESVEELADGTDENITVLDGKQSIEMVTQKTSTKSSEDEGILIIL